MTETPSARNHSTHSGAVRRTSSAASQPPQHDSYARQIEPCGDVTGNMQKGEARVERSFTLGVKAK